MAQTKRASWLVAHLQRLNGWRLWVLFSLVTVVAALVIVSLMDLALMGRITADYLITGLVTAGVLAPVVLWSMSTLLGELALQQQQALSRSVESAESRLRVALDSSDEGVLMVAADGAVLSANKRFLELWRVPPELAAAGRDDLLLQHVLDQLVDPTAFTEGVQRLYGSDAQATDTLNFKDGRVFERFTRALALGAERGRIWCFRDVSDQAHTREALAEREEQYRAIVNQAGEGIDLIDAQTLRFVEVNEAACRMLGYRREELIGRPWSAIQVSLDETALQAAAARVVRDGEASFEGQYRCQDGHVIDVFVSTRAIRLRGRTGLVGVWRDIGKSKAAEEALKESRNLLQTIVDTAPMRVFWKDQNLRYLGCNPAFARDAGKTHPDEILGQDDFQLTWAAQAERYRADDLAVMTSGTARLSFDEPQTTPDGQTLWLRTSKVPLRNARDQTVGVLGVYEDITDRKLAEVALREREQYQRALLDNFPFMVWLKDEQSRLLAVNQAFAQVFGWPNADSLIGKTDLDIAPADLAERYRADDRAVLESGRSKQVEELIERDGRRIWFETYKSPVSIEGRVIGTVGFGRDITERKQAEWNLKMAVEVTQVVFWKIDMPSQAVVFDQGSLPVLGLEPDEALTTLQGWMASVHPDDLGLFTERLTAALQPGDPVFDLEYRMRRRSGGYQWMHTKGSVIQRSADGRPEIAVGTSMNITARKREQIELEIHRQHLEELVQQRTTELLATEARASRILDSAADGLYGVDLQGRITFINAAACRLLGCTAQQAVGRTAHELFHVGPGDAPGGATHCAACRASETGSEWRANDQSYWHADGTVVPVALASHPLTEKGLLVGAVVSVVDVSAQRAAAQAREQALEAAQNLARVRSEFLANMSHEIRTPMNGVLGFARIGQQHHADPEKARHAFEKILVSGHQLLGVVNGILDFSKIDAGKLQIEANEVALHGVLDDAIQLVAERARAKGLELRLRKAANLPRACIGDALRLGQILLNLLSNAIKFTETGKVTLAAELEAGQLVFRVTDTGIGMTAEQLGSLFNPFQQADGSTTRRFGGTGLGLAICKRLLELMQGEIRVESRPGRGSVFEARVPYVPLVDQAPSADSDRAVPLSDQALRGVSILLAEDDEINRAMLEVNLLEAGARLVMVEDGAQAVERVRLAGPQDFDLVLMDIQMPVMDGYEAARRILQVAPALPIIGQTAHAFHEDRDKCLAAGMVGHVAKPIDPPALIKLMLQVLAGRRASG